MQQVKLLVDETTLKELEALADGRKRAVRVDREALEKLLIDYGVMYNAITNNRGLFTVTEPQTAPKRRRPVLRV